MKLHSGIKAGFWKAPGSSRMPAVQQSLLGWNHLQSECHELGQCVHISWGTQGVPSSAHILLWSPLLFFPLATTPWKALLLVRGVSLAQHGFGALHAAGEENGIILQFSHTCMGVSPQTQLCAQILPWMSLLQVFKACYTEITTAHLHLIVQGCSLWKEKRYWKLFMEKSQPGNTCTEVLPGTAPGLQNHAVKLDQTKRKWSVWGFMEHSSPSHGTNWDQEIRYWADLFASSMQHWSGSLINCFLVQFFLQTMTFYPSFFKSCINSTVKHLSSPISIQQNTYFKISDY